ncbi:hypothetical protein [Streptomyces sp. NBC_00893]|uniref:hypothetical protein n=1 Tax=Streptomyces sp. NBC_00893 TaxID=2975862 RepID=UPI00224D94BE|nr:hypothetical protein [Streptomyces sp. NBC_00893]MCX4851751.1 hypothetical protein [Streptomyces sp. NBC_00893]
MSTTHARRRNAGLLAMPLLLAVAFFLAPPLFFPGPFDDFPCAFAAYWSSGGGRGFPADLQHLVDQQFGYHLVRAAITLPLLAVLVALAVRLRRFRLPLAALALAAAALLISNVQGFVSPFGTLLPLLASHPADADLTADLAQARDQLAYGPISPALHVMLDEYVRWHVVKGVLSGLLAAVLIGLSVVAWCRSRRRWYSLLPAVPAVGALVVVVANVTTVANPDPGFLLLLQGSW